MHIPLKLSILFWGTTILSTGWASAFISHVTCPVPVWTIHSVTITYSNETFTPGHGVIDISDSTTLNKTRETVTCDVLANYRCTITGTPSDPNLRMTVLVSVDSVYATFNTTWSCPEDGFGDHGYVDLYFFSGIITCERLIRVVIDFGIIRRAFAMGWSEFLISCPSVITDDMTCTGPLGGAEVRVDGVVVMEGLEEGG